MKEISPKELSKETFSKYGSYYNMQSPKGICLGDSSCKFFHDRVSMYLSSEIVGFSVMQTEKKDGIIDELEYHDHTCEALLPMDGDVYMQVAPASGKDAVPYSQLEVFRIPKGTLVTLRPGVWHAGAFCRDKNSVNILVVLPERCYGTDCTIVKLPEDQKVKILYAEK